MTAATVTWGAHVSMGAYFTGFGGLAQAVVFLRVVPAGGPGGGFLFASAGGCSFAPRGAGVAPVRGGTYFLCAAKKVGKESRSRRYRVLSVCSRRGPHLSVVLALTRQWSETRSHLAHSTTVTRPSSVPAGFAADGHNPLRLRLAPRSVFDFRLARYP